jgi:Tfp pilus assembly protein PilN
MCGLLLAGMVWVPARIDRLEKRLDRLEELSTKLSVMQGLLGDLDKLEKKLSETTQAAAPLARMDSSIDEIAKVLNQAVVPGLNDVKGRMIARTDIDRLTTLLNQINQKLGGAPQTDPETRKIARDLEEVKSLLDATRKSIETSSRDLARDVKQLNLELQKLEAQLQKGVVTPP